MRPGAQEQVTGMKKQKQPHRKTARIAVGGEQAKAIDATSIRGSHSAPSQGAPAPDRRPEPEETALTRLRAGAGTG
eukprot:gene7006-8396_t